MNPGIFAIKKKYDIEMSRKLIFAAFAFISIGACSNQKIPTVKPKPPKVVMKGSISIIRIKPDTGSTINKGDSLHAIIGYSLDGFDKRSNDYSLDFLCLEKDSSSTRGPVIRNLKIPSDTIDVDFSMSDPSGLLESGTCTISITERPKSIKYAIPIAHSAKLNYMFMPSGK